MGRLMKYRAFDTVLNRILTVVETDKYTLEALRISGTIIFDEYSGYSDTAKKEIYEGDVIEALDGDRYAVIFSEGTFVAHRPGTWRPLRMFMGHNESYCTVIGNCHNIPRPSLIRR